MRTPAPLAVSFALAPHGTSLLDGRAARQLLVFRTFHRYERNFPLTIEVQAPSMRPGQWGRSHTGRGFGEKGRPELLSFGVELRRCDSGSLNMDGELDFFLGELVGTTSNELVFDLR